MREADWIKNELPTVIENLRKELRQLDAVPKEHSESATSEAMYHMSRHAKNLNATPGAVSKLDPIVASAKRCEVADLECKAYCVSRALLAGAQAAPEPVLAALVEYMDVAHSALPRMKALLADLEPATRALESVVRPQARSLRKRGRRLVGEALVGRDGLRRALNALYGWEAWGSAEFLTEFAPHWPGQKPKLDRIDQVTGWLLGSYSDKEIARLIPDGGKPGKTGKGAEMRVSNRRRKLTETRVGGGSEKPRASKETRREGK